MKLYLSSYRVPMPRDLFELTCKEPEAIRLALIPNAKDYYAERARNFKIKNVQDDFVRIGISKQKVVDLRDKTQEQLGSELKDVDLIWCIGGNTFCLMEAINKSGFESELRELLEQGVVYGGESAGAIVAGATLKGVEFADQPEFADKLIWDGMGLIDKIIVPHVGSELFGKGVEELRSLYVDNKNLVEITDCQAFVVDGNLSRVVTNNNA